MSITIDSTFLPHDDPDASLASYRGTLAFEHRLTHDIDVWVASDLELMPTAAGWSDASAGRAACPGLRGSTGRSEGEPDVLFEAGQIEPGHADGDREGGPAQQMETR